MTNHEQVWYCDKHKEPVAKTTSEQEEKCPECGESMRNIGWFEFSASAER